MFDATAPAKGEERDVRYVGIWLDDHRYNENYYEDRWAPFVRLVIGVLGQDDDFGRHPRPIFEGTSFANIWGVKFGRAHVDGLFVEVPNKSLADALEAALRLGASIRGILDVDQIEFPRFFSHMLATNAWVVRDVLVGDRDNVPDDIGIRTALVDDYATEVATQSREDVEVLLKDALAQRISDGAVRSESSARTIEVVEDLVVRSHGFDKPNDRVVIGADVAIYDAASMTAEEFDERLAQTVAANLTKKNYRHEIIVWTWLGFSIEYGPPARKSYFVAITHHGTFGRHGSAAQLLKGYLPATGPRMGELSDEATPLLRWQPDSGLTRYWRESPPKDTTITAGKNSVRLRHRIAGVVRRACDDPLDFRIERFALENVRHYEAKEFATPSNMNVFVGANASGKTTILEALAALLRVVREQPENFGESLRDDDVREIRDPKTYKTEKKYPLRVEATIRGPRGKTTSETLDVLAGMRTRGGELRHWMKTLRDRVRNLEPVDLPILAYYGVQRAYQSKDKMQLEFVKPESRLAGYQNALDGQLDPVPFQRWLMTMEIAADQNKKPELYLEMVQEAVHQCIENCETVRYEATKGEIVVHFKGGQWQRFRELSDGYRLMLATIADIALRCVSLNPHLGKAALEETSGIVLIDEIDLHLHPNWQR
ncbi:MAG TPA: AAA family ATPase, partial [Polyangium sp.]|nr:AAA family ATPase [Polyangium sp.]